MEQNEIIQIKPFSPALLALLIWILTSVVLGVGWSLYSFLFDTYSDAGFGPVVAIVAVILSFPVFIVLCIALPAIQGKDYSRVKKIKRLVLTCFLCTVPYGWLASLGFGSDSLIRFMLHVLQYSGILFLCSVVAMLITSTAIANVLSNFPEISVEDQINNKLWMIAPPEK